MNTVIKGRGNVKMKGGGGGGRRRSRGFALEKKIENLSSPFIQYRFTRTVAEG